VSSGKRVSIFIMVFDLRVWWGLTKSAEKSVDDA